MSRWGRAAEIARRWGLVAVVALVARLLYWALVTPHWHPLADAYQYLDLARSLARGRGYGMYFPQLAHHPTAFRPPLLPFVLTPGAWLFGSAVWPARLMMTVIGSGVAVFAASLTASVAGRRAGLAAGLAVALYPPLLANDTVTLTEPLAMLLLLGALIAVDRGRWVVGALCVGGLLLTRPNGYLVVLILAGWVLVRLDWRRALAFAAIALLCLVPWMVRNEIQVHTWEPVTSDGLTLAAVYAPKAQAAGTFLDPALSHAYDGTPYRFDQFREGPWDHALTKLAITGFEQHKRYLFRTIRRNARGYFEITPSLNKWPEHNDGRNPTFRTWTLPFFYVVSVAGLLGVIRRRRDARVIVLFLITLQFTLLSLVLVAPPRLRTPFDVMCCIGLGLLAGAGPARGEGDESTDQLSAATTAA